MQSIKRNFILAFLTAAGSLFPGAAGWSQNQEETAKILALVDAVRQAQRPEGNMKISWTVKDEDPFRVSLAGNTASEDLPLYVKEYTVIYKGIRSRINESRSFFHRSDPTALQKDITSISVFDGSTQKKTTIPCNPRRETC